MRIVINATPLLGKRSGIGRYIYQLAHHLLDIDAENEYTFFYGYSLGKQLRDNPDRVVMAAKAVATRVMKDPWRLREAIHRAVFLKGRVSGRFHLYHEPNFVPLPFPGPLVMTVHDLSVIRYPETHPAARIGWFNRGFFPGLRRASRIITPSQFVKQEVVDELQVDPACVAVTYEAADEHFRPASAEEIARVRETLHLPRHYLLAVGTVEPRKNLPTLLRAYAMLPQDMQRAYPLVIVGMTGWVGDSTHYQEMGRLAQELRLEGKVVFAGYVPDGDLPAVYSGAVALVFPSIYEGFGLPPLEAMACGTPVICSNAASLPEVVGEAGLLVEPMEVESLAAAIERLISSPDLRRDLSTRGLERAKEFSWERCARETLHVYRAAVS